jgi:integrase
MTTPTTRKRRPFIRQPLLPLSPAHRTLQTWPAVNYSFYQTFRAWLRETGYSLSALNIYGVAARLALSLLNKSYWAIDPDADLRCVREYILETYPSEGTVQSYFKGVAKFEQYLRLRCHKPKAEKPVHWATYVGPLPESLAALIREYYEHSRRKWPVGQRASITYNFLSRLTRPLRWLVAQPGLHSVGDLTPQIWFVYLDAQLQAGLSVVSLNHHLGAVQGWLGWLQEQGQPICARMLKVERLDEGPRLPKDAPIEHLRKLLDAIQTETGSTHAGVRRTALMDKAWCLLMLHGGLRTGEVRRLTPGDFDWEKRLIRIEQSKGLKDRLVPMSEAVIEAVQAYLQVRGPAQDLPDWVFIYRHAPLSESYCGQRLHKYYRARTGLTLRPHQLRHSCATLLLNAGAPVVTVQTILGHRHIDTTLGYARLYDGTVAADYYRAMAQVEQRLALPEDAAKAPPTPAELVALVDALRRGTLNGEQAELVGVLRAGLLAMAEQAAPND